MIGATTALLTADEIRAALGPAVAGRTDDELNALARQIRAINRVVLEEIADRAARRSA